MTRFRKASSVQDGDTPVQQTIYRVMWQKGKEQSDGCRVAQIGYGSLAHVTKLHKTTIRRNLRSLQEKYSIEVLHAADPVTGRGTTYRVYPYKQILEHRKEANLGWISRLGHLHSGAPEAFKNQEVRKVSACEESETVARRDTASAPPKGRTNPAAHEIGAGRTELTGELLILQYALWDYVRTDENGRRLDVPPAWAVEAPDEVFVRRIARTCGDQFEGMFEALRRLKRAGKRAASSYGWFLKVLPLSVSHA